jgi:hypothetical protein
VADTVAATFTGAVGARATIWLDHGVDPEEGGAPGSVLAARFKRCSGRRAFSTSAREAAPSSLQHTRTGRLVDARLYAGGLLMFGPMRARRPVTVRIDAHGTVAPTARLVCEQDAASIAAAYLDGSRAVGQPALASETIHGRSLLHLARPTCRTVLIVAPGDGATLTVAAWYVESQRSSLSSVVLCSS